MKKLNLNLMLKKTSKLVENDFCYDMEIKLLPNSKPYTQKEAREMADILSKVYLISHCLHCPACQRKYYFKLYEKT